MMFHLVKMHVPDTCRVKCLVLQVPAGPTPPYNFLFMVFAIFTNSRILPSLGFLNITFIASIEAWITLNRNSSSSAMLKCVLLKWRLRRWHKAGIKSHQIHGCESVARDSAHTVVVETQYPRSRVEDDHSALEPLQGILPHSQGRTDTKTGSDFLNLKECPAPIKVPCLLFSLCSCEAVQIPFLL